MKLFAHPDSGHAYKVKLALTIAGLQHDYEVVDIFIPREQRSEEFRQNAKFQEVPLLIDCGQAYAQSNAILLHLAKQNRVLGGESFPRLERCSEWLFWEANKIGLCLPQLRASAKFESDRLTDGAHAWLSARFEHDIHVLEQELSDGRAFILGDNISIADCSLCGYLFFADEAQVSVPPFVQAWLDRIASLPGWAHPYQLLA